MVDFNRTRSVNRPRRQALITIGMVLIGWVAFYQVRLEWKSRTPLKLEHPPRFFIDLESASEDELQLLPDIGVKTARAWREALDKSFVSLPRKVQELEALPNVGPIRSSKLAPFLVESESCSTTCLDPVTDPARPSVNP